MKRTRSLDRPSAALLGAAVPAGWVAHDLCVFAVSGRPEHALTLMADGALLIVLGGIWGLATLRSRWLPAALAALLAVAVVALRLIEHPFDRPHLLLPRALFLIVVAGAVLAELSRRLALRSERCASLGFAAGVGACLTFHSVQGLHETAWPIVAAALTFGVLGVPRARTWRSLAALLLLAGCAWFAAERVEAKRSRIRPATTDSAATRSVAPAGSPNLVLVVMDTVRADRLSSYGYTRPTTPELDAFLGARATRYTQARSAGSFTFPSHTSLFTGLLPAQHGSSFMGGDAQPLRADATTLAERLHDRGWQTAGIISNRGYFYPRLGLDRGFEHWDNRAGGSVGDYLALTQLAGRGVPVGHQPYREATAITDLAVTWIDEARDDRPFFLFLNYMDAHGPTLPPAPFDELFSDARPFNPLVPGTEDRSLLYDRSLRYLDAELARCLVELEDRGLLENTMLVVTSDHGHAFGDHDFYGHGRYLYEELIHVPLFVQPPTGPAPGTSDELVTALDVHDLMLEQLGIPAEPRTRAEPDGQGPDARLVSEWHHLRGVGRRGWTQANLLCWMVDGVKYIASSDGGLEVYDLERDRGELSPLELDDAATAGAHAFAAAWWSEHRIGAADPAGSQAESEVPTAEELEALRALGYTE